MSISEKNYWQMFNALQRIKAYDPPERMRRHAENDWGCPASEAIEMAYENVIQEAKTGLKGVRRMKNAPSVTRHGRDTTTNGGARD
ncbi:hypothetical protein [Tardiphaga sp.]|uniref:hypothetical protein n=1 Tax=Tardiphaga sp. TaxID=1926292 RepID=UPI00352B05E7